jgi:alkane 1-monooxygenase
MTRRTLAAPMLQALPHMLGFLLPVAVVYGVRLGGLGTFLPVGLLLVVIPILDALSGLDLSSPSEDEELSRNPWFQLVTWAWAIAQPTLLFWTLDRAASGTLTALELTGLTLSVGMTTGTIGLTFAHELVHRAGRFERALGEILLATTSYTQFAIGHVYGHHRHVGTPRDPATARFGESLYAFVPRSVIGSALSAARFEVERLRKRGRAPWHASNRMFRYAATQAAMYVSAFLFFGAMGAVVLALQAAIAIALVEAVNYVEHYGLERRELAPGRYERIMPWHSWDSSHRLTNWMLINLARHADHHMLASKRYQALDPLDTAPQLPAGYGSMFLLALVPPLWRRKMDPRVIEWRVQHASHSEVS